MARYVSFTLLVLAFLLGCGPTPPTAEIFPELNPGYLGQYQGKPSPAPVSWIGNIRVTRPRSVYTPPQIFFVRRVSPDNVVLTSSEGKRVEGKEGQFVYPPITIRCEGGKDVTLIPIVNVLDQTVTINQEEYSLQTYVAAGLYVHDTYVDMWKVCAMEKPKG